MANHRNDWGAEEQQFVLDNVGKMRPVDIAKALGRTYSSLQSWCYRRDISLATVRHRREPWTTRHDRIIREANGKFSAREMAAILSKPEMSVRRYATANGIPLKSVHRYRTWEGKEIAWLKRSAGKVSVKEMSEYLDRSENAIYQFAFINKIPLAVSYMKWGKTELLSLRKMILAGKLREDIPDFPGRPRASVMAKYTVINRELNNRY